MKRAIVNPEWSQAPFEIRIVDDAGLEINVPYLPRFRTKDDMIHRRNPILRYLEVEEGNSHDAA